MIIKIKKIITWSNETETNFENNLILHKEMSKKWVCFCQTRFFLKKMSLENHKTLRKS